jgi:hypothetical protein
MGAIPLMRPFVQRTVAGPRICDPFTTVRPLSSRDVLA